MSNQDTSSDSGMFSFGVRELRNARQDNKQERKKERRREPRLLADPKEKRGFDPYNTSGTYDRSKSWSRIRKR